MIVVVLIYPAGDCDCNGNVLDALDVCGGSCALDEQIAMTSM